MDLAPRNRLVAAFTFMLMQIDKDHPHTTISLELIPLLLLTATLVSGDSRTPHCTELVFE